uniref:Pyridoxal phosphate homeostasis protein n=1 Tax=Rhabditophanes sp. KR3021 TaxID=114890 RepID=A0AC35TN07_9BILA
MRKVIQDVAEVAKASNLNNEVVESIQKGYGEVIEEMALVGEQSIRRAELVAIAKTYPASYIKSLYLTSHQEHFGENKVKELVEKSEELHESCPDIKWHFIGKVQSNKINQLLNVKNLYLIQTVESYRYAELINEAALRKNLPDGSIKIMIQVNTSGEEQKQGCQPEELYEIVGKTLTRLPKLELVGLMTIGMKHDGTNEADFTEFAFLKSLRDETQSKLLADNISCNKLKLSMGMSGDFPIAIKNETDYIRVGTKIFDKPIKKKSKIEPFVYEEGQKDSLQHKEITLTPVRKSVFDRISRVRDVNKGSVDLNKITAVQHNLDKTIGCDYEICKDPKLIAGDNSGDTDIIVPVNEILIEQLTVNDSLADHTLHQSPSKEVLLEKSIDEGLPTTSELDKEVPKVSHNENNRN